MAERPIPRPVGLVNDFAHVIPETYRQKIASVTGALLEKTGVPVVVVTMPDIGGAEYNDYANRLVGEIRDRYMIPYLKEERFGEGLLAGTLAVTTIIAKHEGVAVTGQMPERPAPKKQGGFSLLPILIIFVILMFISRRRGGSWLFFLPLLFGLGGGGGYGSRYSSGGFGGSFGGFGGGFGGFGGEVSEAV
ncbi:MAG: TPM domain-containing protein [Deltaproteobacteria bacterium]|nr:TPM domain-containing protein [Deltaproteobacteria bacterium]